jgi:hypothetical protein
MLIKNTIYRKQLFYFISLLIIILIIFTVYEFIGKQLYRPRCNLEFIQTKENIIKDIEFYQDYSLIVPFIFSSIPISPSDEESPIFVGNIKGEGVISSIVFHTDYYGIALGYSVDDRSIIWINNGHCLYNWGANRPNAALLPVFLLYYNSQNDLSIAVNTPIGFKNSFKLYFMNSDNKDHNIDSLHLYLYGKNIQTGQGNLLRGI